MTEKHSSFSVFERAPKSQRRVVVTGMSAISPVGMSLKENWESLTQGRSGVGPITLVDCSDLDVKIAAEVKNFDAGQFIEKKELKKMDRFIHLAVAASKLALDDCGIDFKNNEALKDRTGVFVGVGIGGLSQIEQTSKIINARGPSRISPFFIPQVIVNLAAGQISIANGFRGPNFSVTSACATGAHSIGEAVRYIRDGICDLMVAGGVEGAISILGLGGFSAMKALSTRNDQPTMASRPFDRDRDGFVMGEGCGILILEDLENAQRRGARIYAEVTGYGVSSDAYHMTNPAPGGAGALAAMKMALNDAQLNIEQITYINAHGTSTPVGDGIETAAVKGLFKEHAKKLWMSSTKSMTGHTLGAAGALESVYSIMTLLTNVAPPTINLDNPSEECDLDYVPHVAREAKFQHVLNNSFGFGGTNASLVFSKLN